MTRKFSDMTMLERFAHVGRLAALETRISGRVVGIPVEVVAPLPPVNSMSREYVRVRLGAAAPGDPAQEVDVDASRLRPAEALELAARAMSLAAASGSTLHVDSSGLLVKPTKRSSVRAMKLHERSGT